MDMEGPHVVKLIDRFGNLQVGNRISTGDVCMQSGTR